MRYLTKTDIKLVILLSFIATIFCFYLKDFNGDHNKKEKLDSNVIPTVKKVTKSLTELSKSKELDEHVLIMNRIPGSGGELIVFLMEGLQGVNNYKHIRLGNGNQNVLSVEKQRKYINTITDFMKMYAVPLSFDKVVHFTNFSQFGQQSLTHISIVRDPIDKLASNLNRKATSTAFYDMKPMKNVIIEMNIRKIVHICNMESDSVNCFKSNGIFDGLSIPYFCGHEPECLKYGSVWALNKAKLNVEKFYPVVGILEHINQTLRTLENRLPYFFRHVQSLYSRKMQVLGNSLYQNTRDISNNSDYDKIRKLLSFEYDFYYWLKRRLFNDNY